MKETEKIEIMHFDQEATSRTAGTSTRPARR